MYTLFVEAIVQNKKSACLLALRERILSTELEPGADLDELSLCETYGVSRTLCARCSSVSPAKV